MSPIERIVWTILALISTVAGAYFFIVPMDLMKSGVAFLAAFVFISWRSAGGLS